jgi:transposase
MAERFVEVDRNRPMWLPADLRDWVPEDDLVHFVIEAVKTLPGGEFMVNERGSGYAQYPPSMMLALLIYCYGNGIFSSRRIERATYRDLGVRFLTGDTHPDHDTICSFGRQNQKVIAKFFVRVLAVLADRGYINGPVIEQIQAQGIEAYVAVSAEAYERRVPDLGCESKRREKPRRYKAPVLVAMEQKLKSPEGHRRYLRRQASVEPFLALLSGCWALGSSS